MGLGHYYASNTATNTITTTSGTTDSIWVNPQSRHKTKPITPKKKKPKGLVRNLPFVNGGDIIETLQREFDFWAGAQRKEIFDG